MIRAARTQNMLLHSALQLLIQREMAAKKHSGNLDGMRKQAKSLRKEFDQERNKTIAMQLQVSSCSLEQTSPLGWDSLQLVLSI